MESPALGLQEFMDWEAYNLVKSVYTICTYTYICTHVHIYTYMISLDCTSIYIYSHVYIHACLWVYTCHMCTHIYTHTFERDASCHKQRKLEKWSIVWSLKNFTWLHTSPDNMKQVGVAMHIFSTTVTFDTPSPLYPLVWVMFYSEQTSPSLSITLASSHRSAQTGVLIL